MTLRVTEIFFSLQGEGSRVGLPTVFIRLTGCPLRCSWCDTEYSFTGGETRLQADILAQLATYPTRHVCVTGGEPLAQKACLPFLVTLCDSGFDVALETSGALDISTVDPRVARIMDLKPPSSGEVARNRWENLEHLQPTDEIKIVIADATDYAWAKTVLDERALTQRCPVLFSPAQGQIEPAQLADWILADGLPVRFQLQLHKIIWGNMRGK